MNSKKQSTQQPQYFEQDSHSIDQVLMQQQQMEPQQNSVTNSCVQHSYEVTTAMLPNTKTQGQPTPMPSLSPVLSHSPAQSAGGSPTGTSAKILQSQSTVLAQNSSWLSQTQERIEKTIELINCKKIKDALQILLDINKVFEQSGVCVSYNAGIDSTKSASPIPSQKPVDLTARRNKSSVQLAIITKYNLACCYQSLGESQKCITFLQQASRQLSYYSNMDKPESGLFKVSACNDKYSTSKKGGGINTPAEVYNADVSKSVDEDDDSDDDDMENFNEYNCIGASSSKGALNGMDNESATEPKQTHDQLSAQLQSNRYLCKFHLQLCAIMSQLGQHVQANENGQQAAAIAEVILIKTHEFCAMAVEELFTRDNKLKQSILDQVHDSQYLDNASKDDYKSLSLKSSIVQPSQHKSVRKLNRGSSVTSLYSQEKERKSVSIRRARSKPSNTVRGRDSSMASCNSDDTTKSLERMYTFNLSRVQKQVAAKVANKTVASKQGETPAGEPASESNQADGQPPENSSGLTPTAPYLTLPGTAANSEEESKRSQTERAGSQTSHGASMPPKPSNTVPTYQVLERTNIQEKQILNVQPLLDEFKRVSEEFNQQNLTLDEAENTDRAASFGAMKEIQNLKTNKRFKINVRNTLGVKDHNNWIYNLNIGNVMNLTPMNSDELNTQTDVFQELSKDTMLEKIILYVVAYFCVGTEIRFQATKMEKKESPQEYIKVWSSEMWHGKSLQIACMFLPEDCPLVDHIIKSYKKHYIGKQSLLSTVVQPKSRTNKPPIAPQLPQSQQAPRLNYIVQSEQKPVIQTIHMKTERPASQQQISPSLAELSNEKLVLQRQKSPLNSNKRPTFMGQDGGPLKQPATAAHQQPLKNRISAETAAAAWGNNKQTQQHKINSKENTAVEDSQKAGEGVKKMASLPTNVAKTSILTKEQIATASAIKNANQAARMASGATKNNQQQKTLKDMVFQNLKHLDVCLDANAQAIDQQQQQAFQSNPMQYKKGPQHSPDSLEGCEPAGENQEAIMIFHGRQRKLSRNKQTASATIIGPDGQEIIEGGSGGHGGKESEDFLENPHPKSASKLIDQMKSPNGRRRAVLPVSQPRAHSPGPQHKPITANFVVKDQKTEPIKKTGLRPIAQTVVPHDQVQRLQQNLNIQIQQSKQKQLNSKKEDCKKILAAGDRPLSAQQTSKAATIKDTHQQISQGSYSKATTKQRLDTHHTTGGSSVGAPNSISQNTPTKRSNNQHHAAGGSNASHKRYQQQQSITSSLQKLVSKQTSTGAKAHSKVLQSEAISSAAAWSTCQNSAKQQGKQKIIMLQNKQKKMQQNPNGGLWLNQDAVKHTGALKQAQQQHLPAGTAKFVDNQLKLLQQPSNVAGGSSNMSTARGAAKKASQQRDSQQQQLAVLSPSQQDATSVAKKDSMDHRKSKQTDLHILARGYETVQPREGAGVHQGSITGLSKSIAKDKFHQQNLIPHQPIQQKMQMHVFNSKLGGGSNGFAASHTLKKSASTRQVVNLLDFQNNQNNGTAVAAAAGHMQHAAAQSNINFHGGSTKQQLASHLLTKHVGGHHQISQGIKQTLGVTQKMATQQMAAGGGNGGHMVGSGAQQPNGSSNFKTLSKKHKNTKSTGLLHHTQM